MAVQRETVAPQRLLVDIGLHSSCFNSIHGECDASRRSKFLQPTGLPDHDGELPAEALSARRFDELHPLVMRRAMS
jgi:hypothetical protein